MGLFRKTPKPDPSIQIGESRIRYSVKHEHWAFTYKNKEFCAYASSFVWPGAGRLDQIIEDFERLQSQMMERIRSGKEIGGGLPMGVGESVLITLHSLETEGTFEVGWSGGEKWGDMGIDFVVKDGTIIEEFWGD